MDVKGISTTNPVGLDLSRHLDIQFTMFLASDSQHSTTGVYPSTERQPLAPVVNSIGLDLDLCLCDRRLVLFNSVFQQHCDQLLPQDPGFRADLVDSHGLLKTGQELG